MPLPFILPVVATAGVAAWNGIVNAFNGASGRTMQKNLEGQRLVHQKELQEKQKVAQLEIEYMRTMSQIKLQQNNQEFQQQLEIARQEFQAKIAEYQCQENRKLQEFVKAVDMQIAKSNQEFQTWLFQQNKQLQIELAQYNRETQFLLAAYQREVALEMKELENLPIKNHFRQMLESDQGRNPVPIQIILAPPEINYDRFEHLNKTSTSTFPKVEKRLSQYLKIFQQKYYPLENEQRPTKLIDQGWESSRFAGGSAVTAIFSRLKSEPIILLESEVDGDLINIHVAYWSGGQEIFPFYKTIISHLHYPKVLYEFAIQRALHWETNVKQKLLAKGKTEQEINQRFGGDNPLNLNIYRENQELAADGIEIECHYKTNSEDFGKLSALLGAYHNIIVALFTDIHYLITTNLSPQLPEFLPELETEFSVDKRLADDLFQMVVESYIGSLRAMEKDRSELVPGFAADISFGLTGLSNLAFAEKMLDFALESWLNSRYLSVENGREKFDVVAENLLPLDEEFVTKVNRCFVGLGEEKKLSVINSCYQRAIEKFNLEKYQEAIIDFTYLIDLNPQFADGYYRRGLTYMKLANDREAVDDLTQVIRLDASHARAYYYRGNAYYKLGEYQQAVDDYNRAINLGLNEAVKSRDIVLGVWQEVRHGAGKALKIFALKNLETQGYKEYFHQNRKIFANPINIYVTGRNGAGKKVLINRLLKKTIAARSTDFQDRTQEIGWFNSPSSCRYFDLPGICCNLERDNINRAALLMPQIDDEFDEPPVTLTPKDTLTVQDFSNCVHSKDQPEEKLITVELWQHPENQKNVEPDVIIYALAVHHSFLRDDRKYLLQLLKTWKQHKKRCIVITALNIFEQNGKTLATPQQIEDNRIQILKVYQAVFEKETIPPIVEINHLTGQGIHKLTDIICQLTPHTKTGNL